MPPALPFVSASALPAGPSHHRHIFIVLRQATGASVCRPAGGRKQSSQGWRCVSTSTCKECRYGFATCPGQMGLRVVLRWRLLTAVSMPFVLMRLSYFKQLHLVGGRQLFRCEGALAARNEASVSEVLHHAYVWSADCASNWLMSDT